jgi:hypothetical protein
MQRMWRQLFAALAGVLAVVSAASAQSPGQIIIPQPLPGGASSAQSIVSPAQVAGAPIATTGGQIYVRGSGGCNGCGSAANAAPCGTPCTTGRGCNNGCGSLKADCGFMFGSCKSFFNPCGVQPMGGGWGGANGHLFGGKGGCGNGCGGSGGGLFGHGSGGCGGGLFGGGHCPKPPLGKPYATGYNGCVYDTYLNH